MRRTIFAVSLAAAAAVVAAGTPGAAAPPSFTEPMRLTQPNAGGFEPSIKVDRHNNVVITAHKNHALLVGPDPHGPAPVRGASHLWHSGDGGKTFGPLPGVTAVRESSLWPAAEGDFALDGAGHLYFVDTYLGDNSITRWGLGPGGKVTAESSRPFQGTGSLDDRPWLAAHGDGVVMYLGNSGFRVGNDGPVAGRYTAYMSYDGGQTFNTLGVNLQGSEWCHGAGDPRATSKRLHVVCTGTAGAVYAYTSEDDGRTFTRRKIGDYQQVADVGFTFPAVAVGRDGTVHALLNDPAKEGSEDDGSRLHHYSSRDGGATWRRADITPRKGYHYYSWLDVASDGTIGVAYYFRAEKNTPWQLYGGTTRPGKPLVTTPIAVVAGAAAAAPHGHFFQVAFGPDRKLHIAYTVVDAEGGPLAGPDVYYVRQK